jgi:hypothetical protein
MKLSKKLVEKASKLENKVENKQPINRKQRRLLAAANKKLGGK